MPSPLAGVTNNVARGVPITYNQLLSATISRSPRKEAPHMPSPLAGVTNDVARGVAIGGTSHALGTASVAASEPKISPPSAVTFLVTGAHLLSRSLCVSCSGCVCVCVCRCVGVRVCM